MSTDDAILQNAAYHAQLLAAIAELDYVPPALEQQTSYIQGIEVESRKTAEKIKVLEKKTTKERKEHEALRDSTARRFAAKITGRKEKFEAKASKEERCASPFMSVSSALIIVPRCAGSTLRPWSGRCRRSGKRRRWTP